MKFLKIAFIFVFAVILVACTSEQEEQSTGPTPATKMPDQESWQSNVTITQDGRRIADIWAGYIALYNKEKVTVLKDSIHVDFYDRYGKHNSVLTADSGRVNNKNNNLLAEGNVIVVSDSGVVLRTDKLSWDNEKQKIISNEPVVFTTPTDTLTGDSFVSDPDLKNYELTNARGYSRRKIPIKNE